MAKVQMVQRFVGTASAGSAHRRRFLVKPKVHILDQRCRIHSSNGVPKNKSVSKQEQKYFKKFLGYYGAKKLSLAVHCVALVIMSIMIAKETEIYKMRPTFTSVESDMYPVQKINFPGVSICNINVISRKEAMYFAEVLWSNRGVKEMENMTLETVKYLMKYMGTLYQFEHKERYPGDLTLLHNVLQNALDRDYNVMSIMKTLSPNCRNFLTDCSWQGFSRKCDELFVPRWTPEGYCCTFNHVRWNDRFNGEEDAGFKINIERAKISGTEYGLHAFLKPDLEDYYYTLIPGRGFKVFFYNPSDYPDAPSGGLREVLVSPGSEAFLSIRATSFYSSPEVMTFDKRQRLCLFNTEIDEIYGGSYSYSQCRMFCRVSDVRNKCGCIPFFYPIPDDVGRVRICTVKDSICLQRYKYRWWSVDPIFIDFVDHSNLNINEDGPDKTPLRCDCWPSCENVDYTVFMSSSNIQPSSLTWTECAKKNMTRDDIVLSVSFGSPGSVRLKQDVMFYWYDLMSNYGGLCSLFLGISIMTPVELIYLLFLRFWQRWKNRSSTFSPSHRLAPAASVKTKTCEQPIYWSEIMLPKRPT